LGEGKKFFTGIGIGLVLVFRFCKNEAPVWYGNGIGSLVHFIGNFSVHWHKLVPLVFHIGNGNLPVIGNFLIHWSKLVPYW
jgi:hypothetical protein